MSRICTFDYSPSEGVYDEIFTADGIVRPPFAEIVRRLEQFGPNEFARRRQCIRHVLHENDLLSSARQRRHSDGLDPLPLVIAPLEWGFLDAGLKQRSRLFNALAADLYGEQKLWRKGILPPALIHANPDFLPVVCGVRPPSGIWVHLSGVDVVRNAYGNFYVTGDHLQSPEGLGKALENRLAVSRGFPVMFRDLYVEKLARFFKTLQDCFSLVSSGQNYMEKRIVLLATSPEHEKRNEDAVLARYLGLQLVENDDLAVRGMNVYLKTLVGLKKIDTIFRRIDDGMCDPLELRIDSGEGASGLISSMRTGNVSLVNAIGSGALEAPFFRAFLPQIAQELLGEEMILPTLSCRWLGDKAVLDDATAHPENLVFKPAFGLGSSYDYSSLTPAGQLAILENLMRAPEEWVAEEKIHHSSSPVWSDGGWKKADVSMRFFTVNSPEAIHVMPGGLGIFRQTETQRHGEKDIWVLSNEPVTQFSLLAPAEQAVQLSRAGGDLPSRSAANLFILGSHIEIAEQLARLTRAIAMRLADQTPSDAAELAILLEASKDPNALPPPLPSSDPESTIWSLSMKNDHQGGIQQELTEIRRLATQLRDRISEDTWILLHSFGESGRPDGSGASVLIPYLSRIISESAAFAGLANENMTRGHGWRFQELGRRTERAKRYMMLMQSCLAREIPDEQSEILLLQALIETGDCSLTYHRRYGGRLQAAPVIDLFICDETNPRSVVYQLQRISSEARKLPRAQNENLLLPLDREILRLLSDLRLADVTQLAAVEDGERKFLSNELERWLKAIDKISDLIDRDYLNHAPRRQGSNTAMATEV